MLARRATRVARAGFTDWLALMMIEAGKATLIETRPGEAGTICVVESSAGERFALVQPAIGEEREAEVLEDGRNL